MRKAELLKILTLKTQQALGRAPQGVLPLQRELRLLLFVPHDLRDASLLSEVRVGRPGPAVVAVRILFFRGEVSVAQMHF